MVEGTTPGGSMGGGRYAFLRGPSTGDLMITPQGTSTGVQQKPEHLTQILHTHSSEQEHGF